MDDACAAAEELFFSGNRHLAANDAQAAEDCFRRTLELKPDFAEALANLALLRERAGAAGEAEDCYQRAIALQPDNVQLRLNFAVFLANGKRFADAEVASREALQRSPRSAAAWSNYGVLLACVKREAEAEQCYRTALALDENYAKARFNLAYIQLRQGRFDEGWACLEDRPCLAQLAARFAGPRWRGEALAGKSIVLVAEGGYGDTLQFCRYAALLKARGAARVALVCQPELQTLLATLTSLDAVHGFAEPLAADYDLWAPLLSLPGLCRTRQGSIPATLPYLSADPVRSAHWRSRLPAQGVRVGVAWRGNPLFENDGDRSLPGLALLAPLAAIPGIQLVSLQKGVGEDEARNPPPGLALTAVGHRADDFAESAAIISELDLVISVDSALAHLSGALGKPCWLLLPDYKCDWRWGAEGGTSDWYPHSMRLFRQRAPDTWPAVIADVAAALAVWHTRSNS